MRPTVVFVLGGPGAGKGTQCSRLAQQYRHIHHISIGDVLRAESAKFSSQFASIIAENMKNGTIGPMEITVEILKREIDTAVRDSDSDRSIVILLDGFPRKLDQLELFEAVVQPADFAILLECEDNIRLKRLLQRAKHGDSTRQDDNPETIQKRFSAFSATTIPVIDNLETNHRLIRVSGEGSADDTSLRIDSILRRKRIVMESCAEIQEI